MEARPCQQRTYCGHWIVRAAEQGNRLEPSRVSLGMARIERLKRARHDGDPRGAGFHSSLRTEEDVISSGSKIEQLLLLIVLVYVWWGLPLSLVLSGAIPSEIRIVEVAGYGIASIHTRINFSNALLVVWLSNTVIPIFPGAGFLAAVVGTVRGERFFSFLLGLLPNALTGFLFVLASLITGPSTLVGAATLFTGGVGLGFMGLAGSINRARRGDLERVGTARLSALLFFGGLAIWLIVTWGWPTLNLGFPRAESS